MSPAVLVGLLALGFGVIAARRRSHATWLLGAQSMLLGVAALAHAEGSAALVAAGAILVVRGFALPALLVSIRRRTPEPGPVTATTSVGARLLAAAAVCLLAVAATPPLGLAEPGPEHAAVALVYLGIAIVIARRPALHQLLGILVAENGVYLLAVSVPGGLPFVVELGVLFDLALVITVAATFAHRIHGELGSGDTDLLRRLRD